MIKEITDPESGLFVYCENQTSIQLSDNAFLVPDYDLCLRILGRLIGKALVEGYEIGVDFTKPFLKQILGITLNLSDLQDIDSLLYHNLHKLI